MKAVALFYEDRSVRVIDHPEPASCGAHEVRLKMLEVGVCGTDKEICNFEFGAPPLDIPYLILGHEALGEVIEVGREVERFKTGDLVIPTVRRPCAQSDCLPCLAGRQDFCSSEKYTERGIYQAHGFLTERVLEHERYLVSVPQELRSVGILVEPLTVTEKALHQISSIQSRLSWENYFQKESSTMEIARRAVVLGAGPVGLLAAMCFVMRGYRTYVYSRSPAPNPKSEIAESIGATYVSSQNTSVDDLAEIVGQIDLVYEAAGDSRVAFDLLRVLGTNGLYVFTGVPALNIPTDLDTDRLMRNLVLKNQVVLGTVNASLVDFANAVKSLGSFVEKWPEAVKSLITGHYQMSRYYDVVMGKAGGIKNVIDCD